MAEQTTPQTETIEVTEPEVTVTDAVAHRLAQGYVAFRDSGAIRKGALFAGLAAINPVVGMAAAGGYVGAKMTQVGRQVREEIDASQG